MIFNRKNKILLTLLLFILLIISYNLYNNYKYNQFVQLCSKTTDNYQIGDCADDNNLDDYEKLLYFRSKNEYITGGRTLSFYDSLTRLYESTEEENLKILSISKKCLTTDSICLSIYIQKNKPDDMTLLNLYENLLKNTKNLCNNYYYLLEYKLLSNKYNIPLKYEKKC